MIESMDLDGRKAQVQYLTKSMQPTSKAAAAILRVTFTDSPEVKYLEAPVKKSEGWVDVFKRGNPYRDKEGRFARANTYGGLNTASAKTPLTKAQVAKRLEKLAADGITVNVTDSEWMAHTNGQIDPVEFVQKIWSKESYDNKLIEAQVHIDEESGNLALSGTGTLYGSKVQYCERQINMGAKAIDHTYLKLAEGEEGAGTVKKMFAEAIPFYKKSGFEQISVHANLEAGAYAWGRYGFQADDPQDFKRGLEDGWGKIVKARSDSQKGLEYKTPLSAAAKKELDNVRDMAERLQNDPRIAQIMTGVKTPNLDAEVGHLYQGLSPKIPARVPRNFMKVALYEQHWYGRLPLGDDQSMSMLTDYLTPKKP